MFYFNTFISFIKLIHNRTFSGVYVPLKIKGSRLCYHLLPHLFAVCQLIHGFLCLLFGFIVVDRLKPDVSKDFVYEFLCHCIFPLSKTAHPPRELVLIIPFSSWKVNNYSPYFFPREGIPPVGAQHVVPLGIACASARHRPPSLIST